jgi:hypothetical protein
MQAKLDADAAARPKLVAPPQPAVQRSAEQERLFQQFLQQNKRP